MGLDFRQINPWQLAGAAVVGWLGFYYSLHPDRAYQSFLHGPSLIIHEAGHFIWAFLGWFMTILGGSLNQVLIPVVFTVYFWRTRQRYAAFVTLFWVGFNLLEVAVYMGDATARALPLITDEADPERESHDWYQLLGHFGHLSWDKGLYRITWLLGTVCNLVAFAGAAWTALNLSRPQPETKSELEHLPNLGPRAAQMLESIGIQYRWQLENFGAVETYRQLRKAGYAVNPVMLLALHGALSGRKWSEIPLEEQTQLKKQAGLDLEESLVGLQDPPTSP